MYRLNTYPLIHLNFMHALFNAVALLPLMERFEAEHGTLLTGAMFVGREPSLGDFSNSAVAKLFVGSSLDNPCGFIFVNRARNLAGKCCCSGIEVGST